MERLPGTGAGVGGAGVGGDTRVQTFHAALGVRLLAPLAKSLADGAADFHVGSNAKDRQPGARSHAAAAAETHAARLVAVAFEKLQPPETSRRGSASVGPQLPPARGLEQKPP